MANVTLEVLSYTEKLRERKERKKMKKKQKKNERKKDMHRHKIQDSENRMERFP